MSDLLFGSFLRGPRRRGPVRAALGLGAGTVPVGTVRVCAPVRLARRRAVDGGSDRRGPGPARSASTGPSGSLEPGVADDQSAPGGGGCATRRSVAGSTTTRSNRSGSRGSGAPSGRTPRSRQPVRRRPDARCACGGRRSPQAGRSRRPAAPADLDDHERRGRTRVDRHEIELVATDMDVPGQDRSSRPRPDERATSVFGGITRLLGRRPRRVAGSVRHAARSSQSGLIGHVSATAPTDRALRRRRQLQRREVERVERRVVGHDRHELAVEQVVRLGDAAGSPSRSRSSWSPASVRWSARNERAVERRQPELADRHAVLERGVALVALPAVARVAGGQQGPSSGRGRPWRRPTRRRSSRPWRRRRRCSCTARPAASKPAIRLPSTSTCSWPPSRAIARRIARCVAW